MRCAQGGNSHAWLWLLALMLQFYVCVGDEEQEHDHTPLGPELSLVVLMLTFSVLFIWEAGKACINSCRTRREEVQVAALRGDEDEHNERRIRRQEAVRRAIVSETEGLRRRRTATTDVDSSSEPPVHSYVHVQVEAPRPPPPPPLTIGHSCDLNPGLSTGFMDIQPPTASSSTHRSSTKPAPPPPVQFSGEGLESPARREVATQTEERRGISYEELQELQVLTSTSRTPGVVHLFPGCQALRGVSTHRRTFCRYCLHGVGRTGI